MRKELEEKGEQRVFWIGGPDYDDCQKEFRVLWNDMKRMKFPLDRPGSYNSPWAGSMRISLWNGLFVVETKSAKDEDSWDGEGLSGIVLVEAAKLKFYMWDKYVRPALADKRGWSLATGTPEGKNWLYNHWRKGQNERLVANRSWQSWRFPSYVNTTVFPGGVDDPEIIAMKQDMSPEMFNQQVEAMFTEFVGRVFKNFDEEIHVKPLAYNPSLPLFGAVDYGFKNPFVWLAIQVDVFDNVYVLGEYRTYEKDIGEIIPELQRWPLARNAVRIYPDPEDPGSTNALSRALRVRSAGSTGGKLNDRLKLIRKWLRFDPASEGHPDDVRQPKLFIDRSCVGLPMGDGGLIREMQDYRYPDTKLEYMKSLPENPLKKDDHGPEALGRFFKGYFGTLERGDNRARERKAVIASGRR
jgi:hypothetical protein